jgi:hypothetical protein
MMLISACSCRLGKQIRRATVINLHSDIVAEFEQLTTMPWSEYAERCAREHAQSILDEQLRTGEVA